MKANWIVFNEDKELYIDIEELDSKVCLILSDDLYAYEEELTDKFKEMIADFLQNVSVWHPQVVSHLINVGKELYGDEITEQSLELMNIFILFEQNEAPLFGLGFRAEYDIEHGCGVKIDGRTFEILEIGAADVAFC